MFQRIHNCLSKICSTPVTHIWGPSSKSRTTPCIWIILSIWSTLPFFHVLRGRCIFIWEAATDAIYHSPTIDLIDLHLTAWTLLLSSHVDLITITFIISFGTWSIMKEDWQTETRFPRHKWKASRGNEVKFPFVPLVLAPGFCPSNCSLGKYLFLSYSLVMVTALMYGPLSISYPRRWNAGLCVFDGLFYLLLPVDFLERCIKKVIFARITPSTLSVMSLLLNGVPVGWQND